MVALRNSMCGSRRGQVDMLQHGIIAVLWTAGSMRPHGWHMPKPPHRGPGKECVGIGTPRLHMSVLGRAGMGTVLPLFLQCGIGTQHGYLVCKRVCYCHKVVALGYNTSVNRRDCTTTRWHCDLADVLTGIPMMRCGG